MAAGAITLTEDIATIEVANTSNIATKSLLIAGYIVNGGTTKVFINTQAATPATTDTQAQSVVGLPPGASFPIPLKFPAFSYIVASGTGVLYWIPSIK